LRCAEARRVAYRDVDESLRVSSTSPNVVQSRGDFKTALLPQNVHHLFVMPSVCG
jgi:hypothetical protein